MRVSELAGALLDYWVAKAEKEVGLIRKDPERFVIIREDGTVAKYSPSTDWALAGPIIDREKIMLDPVARYREKSDWMAQIWCPYQMQRGATALIAAMRAYVALKFGDDVPDEPAA